MVAAIDEEAKMAVARVVTFEGVSSERMAELKRQMEEGDRPEGMPPAELIVLHDADSEKSLVVIVFDSDEDYRRGDEILNAMPTDGTPGSRTSVSRFDVAHRMKG